MAKTGINCRTREVKDLNAEDRLRIRQDKSLPLVQTLHDWLMLNRQKVPEGSATAKAIDYSLRRWCHFSA